MSKYRCPICGAGHNTEAKQCRLCGQSLTPDAISTAHVPVAQPMAKAKGIKTAVLIGLGVVLSLLLLALAVGWVKPNSQIRAAKDVVTERADGWTNQVEEQGAFTIDMPAARKRLALTAQSTADGNLTAWVAELGTDTTLAAGWGKTPGAPLAAMTPTAATTYLKDVIAPRWMAERGLEQAYTTSDDITVAGLPAIYLRTSTGRVQHNGQDGYAFAALVLNGDTVYHLLQDTIYNDPAQLRRMINSFTVTGRAA
jgi:hypothetical protein